MQFTAGGGLAQSSPETERKSIWPKSTRHLQNFILGIIIYVYKRDGGKSDPNPKSIVSFWVFFAVHTMYAKHTTFPPCFFHVYIYVVFYTVVAVACQRYGGSNDGGGGDDDRKKWPKGARN